MSCAEQFIWKLLRKLNSPVYAHLLLHHSLQESMKSFVIITSRLCLPILVVTFLFHRSERSTLEKIKGPFSWTVLPLRSSVRDSRATSSVMFFLVPQPEVLSLALSLSRLVTTSFLHPSPFCIALYIFLYISSFLPFFMRFLTHLPVLTAPVWHRAPWESPHIYGNSRIVMQKRFEFSRISDFGMIGNCFLKLVF